MGREATEGIEFSADPEGRLEAGFSEPEVREAFQYSEAGRVENLVRKKRNA
jgi:hypothetical protein